ncbi:type VI secretion system tube protein TssD [Aquimarina muelleri]|uniref:Type VI secretion system needle protein Hcp n=1 Tax=Aquimarina muelleri TaxID=279356 RepID=A0A918N4N4_9FLAO|nr:type VI secretion system tube protein TssD [Aquimarina muelleri]MCX2764507.1 type VI secretion system tube protein TssD [Aquimarina muelleri]GGX30825.1 hypothetical protein GCM10007384_34930 [Aquimarina muelleri]
MGSFRASIKIGEIECDVLDVEYIFSRDTDKKGKVSSNVYGGRINVTVESTSDTSIIEAMLNSQFKAVDATITFKKTDEDTKLKTAEIVNAYIVYYKESLNVNGEEPMTINFTLSAEKITIGNAEHINRWANS